MTDILRIALILLLTGAALTAFALGAAWWMEEERRLSRLVRRVLGGEPDATIVAHGRNAAAGFRLETRQATVMSHGGAQTLVYSLEALLGAELIVDGQVAARTFRDEPRRALDAVSRDAQEVTLRLLFDNPRDPDFELELWPPPPRGKGRPSAQAAIQEARTWIARAEAILRRPGGPGAAVVGAPRLQDEAEGPPFDDEDH